MAHVRRHRGRLIGTALPQPGEDDEPTEAPERPTIDGVDSDDPAFPFIVRTLALLATTGFDPHDPALISRAVDVGRAHWAEAQTRPKFEPFIGPVLKYQPPPPPPPDREPRVYYMRTGNRCKIGYTANLLVRMRTITPEELLAVEPGTQDLERHRQKQFTTLRTHGEWFRLEEPLISHIAGLRPACRDEIDRVMQRLTGARARSVYPAAPPPRLPRQRGGLRS